MRSFATSTRTWVMVGLAAVALGRRRGGGHRPAGPHPCRVPVRRRPGVRATRQLRGGLHHCPTSGQRLRHGGSQGGSFPAGRVPVGGYRCLTTAVGGPVVGMGTLLTLMFTDFRLLGTALAGVFTAAAVPVRRSAPGPQACSERREVRIRAVIGCPGARHRPPPGLLGRQGKPWAGSLGAGPTEA